MPSAEALLDGVEMPPRHRAYYASLRAGTERALERAREAKATLADSTPKIDALLAFDLADRVSKMLEVDVASRLRGLLEEEGKERAALTIAREIALGAHMPGGSSTLERLDRAVRVGLATVTEGVTIAPLQGIAEVSMGENRDGSEYLSLSIAGPMRSAGGTESAVTMLIADHVRQAAGLGRYRASSFDDEPGRFVEELRIYEREASNFQYRVTDADIITVISSLPVCLDGVDTDPYEVVNHKGMARIRTDRVRGGALRVLNDGLIGRSKKLLQRVERYGISGWEWLGGLEGATPKRAEGDDDDTAASKRMREVITGRSVLSKAGTLGGFRLRYGRACNTGFTSVGMHPAVAELLEHVVAVGTQVKTDVPGKGATVAFVDSIDAPTVRLRGGDVVRVRDAAHAASIRGAVEEVLHLGDLLVSFGDFVENGATMPPSGYVEEWWAADLRARLGEGPAGEILAGGRPSAARALEISRSCGVPLHPAHLHYWDEISAGELDALLSPESREGGRIAYGASAKETLERLAVPHRAEGASCVLDGEEAEIFEALLFGARPDARAAGGTVEAISAASGVEVRPKFSTSVAVRVGRPEKAAARKMKPPAHLLFPVGEDGGPQRSLAKAAAAKAEFFADLSDRTCAECGEASIAARCACGGTTAVSAKCPRCGAAVPAGGLCERCDRRAVSHSHRRYALGPALAAAQERVRVRAREPLKGVRGLVGQGRVAEPIEKGLLRQAHGLYAFKDGTVRYEATNAPLTHFRPAWIGVEPSRLRELGYETDIDGRPLEEASQVVEMFTQDAIIPAGAAEYLLGACRYVDDELERLYGVAPYYGARRPEDLVGHLVVGLAPHTSVGIVTRVIGLAGTHVCLGTPNWHSAKRRDADGDADALMMLLDVFLNFSREFLSDRIGGLMDAPLLIQPYVLPQEAQSQAHNLEVVRRLPLEFFEATLSGPKATDVKCVETVKSRLEAGGAYEGYGYTHETSSLSASGRRSAYSALGSMDDKLELQIRVADKINAVDTAEIVSNVISTHLVPDLVGNLRAYATQEFRCTRCGAKYRRIPLSGACTGTAGGGRCENALTATITRASVSKYLKMATRLVEEYDVGAYQRGRIRTMAREIEMVFGDGGGSQTVMGDYA